jgi:superfamily II DNA or RNA helicase
MMPYLDNAWDGVKHFFSKKTRKFRSGLIWKVAGYLEDAGIEHSIYGWPVVDRLPQTGNYEPRDYQGFGVDATFTYLRGIIKSPPRSGKTLMASAFIDQSRIFPTIFFCNSIDIASQTIEKFARFIPDVSVGLVGDGNCEIRDVTIMTVQSAISAYEVQYKTKFMARRTKAGKAYKKIGSENPLTNEQRERVRQAIETAQLVMYDECHHSKSATAMFLFNKMVSARVILGLSATPNAGTPEDMLVEASIGSVIYEIRYEELIAAGHLLPPVIWFLKLPKVEYDKNSLYPTIYRAAITDNPYGNAVIAECAKHLMERNKSVLIVVDKKNHGDDLGRRIPGSLVLFGNAELEHRNDVKEQLVRKELLCVISTLWDEGTDIPSLDFVINGAGGDSLVDLYQRLRSITPDPNNPDKVFGGLIDFIHQEKYLSGHSKRRKRQYDSEPAFMVIEQNLSKVPIGQIADVLNFEVSV